MIGEFEDKGILIINQGDEETMMHYVKCDNHYYSITLGSSEKVKGFKSDNLVDISFKKGSDKRVPGVVNIIDKSDIVENLYKRMSDIKFCWFKEYSEDLVILDITL